MSKKLKSIRVKFMGHGGSGDTERISLRVELSERDRDYMLDTFVGAQLQVSMVVSASKVEDATEQQELIDVDDKFDGVAECRRLTIDTRNYGLSLAFVANEIDVAALVKMSGKSGTMTVERIGDATEREEKGEE